MNNYSIFGPTIYIENQSQRRTSNSTPNLNDLFSNIFSTEFNDIIRNTMNNNGENVQRNTTEAQTDTSNIEEVVFLYEPTVTTTTGLSFQEINQNTSLDISSVSETAEDENMCVICHQTIENNSIVRKINHCSHFFHVHCIDRWFNSHNNCPTCRHVLSERQNRYNRPMYQFRYGRDS